jgi:hypothetical protein
MILANAYYVEQRLYGLRLYLTLTGNVDVPRPNIAECDSHIDVSLHIILYTWKGRSFYYVTNENTTIIYVHNIFYYFRICDKLFLIIASCIRSQCALFIDTYIRHLVSES